jgi:hypothetical protein
MKKILLLLIVTCLLSFKSYSNDNPIFLFCNLDNLGMTSSAENIMKMNYEERRYFFKNWLSDVLSLDMKIPNPSPSQKEWVEKEMQSEDINRLKNLLGSKEWNLINANRQIIYLFDKIAELNDDAIRVLPEDKRLDYEKLSISILAAQLLDSGIYSSFNELAKHSIINREHYRSDLSSTYSFCMEAAQKLILLSASLKK